MIFKSLLNFDRLAKLTIQAIYRYPTITVHLIMIYHELKPINHFKMS